MPKPPPGSATAAHGASKAVIRAAACTSVEPAGLISGSCPIRSSTVVYAASGGTGRTMPPVAVAGVWAAR